ncbi:hypothetical protein Clacol_007082 [Clathrus columnatus]|uniref:Terpene synthase n=1 Tax=Clathrus columnatus TaxID=1419009 RepID=A0AAV5AGS5_9AGAM|nr:hypothetical protein Clacol_007082 [Clathrus columnatus]
MVNSYHISGTVSADSANWIDSFKLFSPARQLKFRLIDIGTLTALSYPLHSKEHFRIACDFMNLLFAVDDLSDNLDPHDVRQLADTALDVILHPEKLSAESEHPVGHLHKDFWERLSTIASKTCLDRFVKSYRIYMNAMVQEAKERNVHSVRTSIEEYLKLRRGTSAIQPSFDLLLLPLDIPRLYLESSSIKKLEIIAIDLIAVANDIVSFNVEQARGDIHNFIIVLMNQHNLSIQQAMDLAGNWYKTRARQFLDLHNFLLESHSDNDPGQANLKVYIRGIANWVTANYEWSFESQRFFGALHREVYRSGVVDLLPRCVTAVV